MALAGTMAFPDHHRYTRADVHGLLAQRKRYDAKAFLTTEKDAINLEAAISELAPLHVVPVQMQIEDAARMFEAMVDAMKVQKNRFNMRQFEIDCARWPYAPGVFSNA